MNWIRDHAGLVRAGTMMEPEEEDEFDNVLSCFELEPLKRELGIFYLEALNHLDIWYHRPGRRADKKKGNGCVLICLA